MPKRGTSSRGQSVATALSPTRMFDAAARTSAFAARSARRSVLPSRMARRDIPARRPTFGVLTSVFAEELMLLMASRVGQQTNDADEFPRIAEDTQRALTFLDANGWLDDPASYHQTPPAPADVRVEAGQLRNLRYSRLSFDSNYLPPAGMPGTDRWLAVPANRRCYAHLLEHRDGKPRPWLVYLHMAGMGSPFDLTFMRALRYHRDLGFNVLAPVLPLHGSRRDGAPGGPALVSLDWVANVHGFTQAVWDVRRCLAWIRERGASSIAVHGMSLGGYTTALVAGLEPDLDCVVAGLPAATVYRPLIAAAASKRTVRRTMESHDLLGDSVEAVHRVITPTAYPCQVPRERRFIYAGLADRISTPREPYLLWEHWDKPTILWSKNTHMGTAASPRVRRFVRQAVTSCAGQSHEPSLAS